MLNLKSVSVWSIVLVGMVSVLVNCSLSDEKKESGSCFLIAEPAMVAPGESTEIKPGP